MKMQRRFSDMIRMSGYAIELLPQFHCFHAR
jgi:hypothetical protein